MVRSGEERQLSDCAARLNKVKHELELELDYPVHELLGGIDGRLEDVASQLRAIVDFVENTYIHYQSKRLKAAYLDSAKREVHGD